MMVFTRKIEHNQERSFWISKLWKYFSKYFVLIPRYVVSVMFLQNTRLYSCFCPDYPVTFLDQSEERSTSHLMNSRPIAELVIFWCLLSFTTWVSCYYWWSSLLKSPQSSLKYHLFTSFLFKTHGRPWFWIQPCEIIGL